MNLAFLVVSLSSLVTVVAVLWLKWQSAKRWIFVLAAAVICETAMMMTAFVSRLVTTGITPSLAIFQLASLVENLVLACLPHLVFFAVLTAFDTRRSAFTNRLSSVLFGCYVASNWGTTVMVASIVFTFGSWPKGAYAPLDYILSHADLAAEFVLFLSLTLLPLALWRILRK